MAHDRIEIGDLVKIRGEDHEVVGISRFSSPILNWALCDVKPGGSSQRSLIIDMPRAVYEAEKTGESPEELQEKGLRAAQQGEARMAILGGEETDVSDCEFTYYRTGDEQVALVIEGRQGTETYTGSRLEDDEVDINPE